MATATTSFTLSVASDAVFRAWGSWISSLFGTFGWTAEYSLFATGTNWTDVTTPAADSTARVTEIWKMADSLQASAPLFLKIEYGRVATTAPAFRLSIGTGHSGSGTLTGVLWDTGAGYRGTAQNLNTVTNFASGDTNRIWFSLGVTGTGTSATLMLGLSVERRKNSDGTDAATGFLLALWSSSPTGSFRVAQGTTASGSPTTTPVTGSLTAAYSAVSGSQSLTYDGHSAVAPVLYHLGPSEIGLALCAGTSGVTSPGATFVADVFGASHTFLQLQGPSPVEPLSQTMTLLAGQYE